MYYGLFLRFFMIICLFQGVDESIKLLQNSGVKVCMITGDGQATATAIATMLGRGCQLYINGSHLFPKRPQFCKLRQSGKRTFSFPDAGLLKLLKIMKIF